MGVHWWRHPEVYMVHRDALWWVLLTALFGWKRRQSKRCRSADGQNKNYAWEARYHIVDPYPFCEIWRLPNPSSLKPLQRALDPLDSSWQKERRDCLVFFRFPIFLFRVLLPFLLVDWPVAKQVDPAVIAPMKEDVEKPGLLHRKHSPPVAQVCISRIRFQVNNLRLFRGCGAQWQQTFSDASPQFGFRTWQVPCSCVISDAPPCNIAWWGPWSALIM